MEAFSQHQSSFLDYAYYHPTSPVELPLFLEELTNSSSYFPYYNSEATPEVSATDPKTYESSSSLDTARDFPAGESQMDYSSAEAVAEPHGGEEVPTPQSSMEKRSKRNRTGLSSPQSKDIKAGKKRMQKSPFGGLKGTEEKRHKTCEEPHLGYIHVRARRGQATDSHSLAERARREKISERMRMLQDLVPGCYMVTGKALVLDEIINYVQSLQNQVEFLSMKLASLSPMLYGLGDDYERRVSKVQPNHIQPTGFENADNYPIMEYSLASLLPFTQDKESFLVQVDGTQGQVEFNICSF